MNSNVTERETTDIVHFLMKEHHTINETTLQKHIELESDRASRPNYQFTGPTRDAKTCHVTHRMQLANLNGERLYTTNDLASLTQP